MGKVNVSGTNNLKTRKLYKNPHQYINGPPLW